MPSHGRSSRTKEKSFSTTLKDPDASITAVVQHYKAISTLDEMQQQIHDLTSQLAEANKNFENLRGKQKQEDLTSHTLTAQFENRVMDAQFKTQTLNEKAEGYHKQVPTLEVQLERERTTNSALEFRLQQGQRDLKDLRAELEIDELDLDFVRCFEVLESSLNSLSQRFFKEPSRTSEQVGKQCLSTQVDINMKVETSDEYIINKPHPALS
ncbi:hypothetical protein BBP40_002199 [Aspergillus hancockii]|nr:hypothetical protein BBP40_002199 [Aspergillus hancockii]